MKKHNVHTQQKLAKKIVRRTARRGTVFVASGAIFWAFSSACVQFLTQSKGFDAEWLASVRILIAGIILFTIGSLNNKAAAKTLLKSKKDLAVLALYGVFGLLLLQFSCLKAIAASNSGTATVLQYLGPIFIIFLICIKELRLPKFTETISIVFAVTGVFLLATHGSLEKLAISKTALFWGVMSALGLMFVSIIPSKLIPKYGSLLITGAGMLCGGIILLFIVKPWTYSVSFDAASILTFICIAFIGTPIGYTLYTQGVSDIGPVKSSMIASIEPVASALFASFLGTKFVWWQDFAGMACIVATVFILSLPAKHIKVSFKPTHKKELVNK